LIILIGTKKNLTEVLEKIK